ncbi:putative lecithin:cholesterol acyltransferase [Leptopilina boulardi filamentous virus]|uniref:Putative lecithin:cholesterol acyltransferase n=1 Tax=Leptopilina boulardi filamentous virus TaxID=552509 RepID=A0A1S5YD05_9VIRU|nr:putative lecithin:cholesterol acyltransferase [Leptopilina boulardi filamentous virus]AQQ79980.1 putative lecithin:cholesterol acyltransferase [Leptopilina boulardi filamentous virus]
MTKKIIIFIGGMYSTELVAINKEKEKTIVYPPNYINFLKYKYTKSKLWNNTVKDYLMPEAKKKIVSGSLIEDYFGYSIYKNFLNSLRQDNNLKVLTYSYDWRQNIITIAENFQQYLISLSLLLENKNNEIILIGHSLGGYIIRVLLETKLSFFSSILNIKKCFFCGCPFFGQHGLLDIYKKMYIYELETYNINCSKKKITHLYNNILSLIGTQYKTTFFSLDMMFQFLLKFKHSLMLLIPYDELLSLNNIELSNIFQVDKNYSNYILDLSKKLAYINKRDDILYICVYNLKNVESSFNENNAFLNDGKIFYTNADVMKMNNCNNFIQIRDKSKYNHALMLNSDFIIDKIKEVIYLNDNISTT